MKAELLVTGHVLAVTLQRKQMVLLGIWSLTLFGSGPVPCGTLATGPQLPVCLLYWSCPFCAFSAAGGVSVLC